MDADWIARQTLLARNHPVADLRAIDFRRHNELFV